jgi:quercetin dioxygenase-like cupin family protein
MALAQLIDPSTLTESMAYPAPFCSAHGAITTKFSQPEGFDQWVVTAKLPAGSEVEWTDRHGDEALYVVSGRVQVGDKVCVAGGAVVIESGAPALAHALENSDVVHMGSTEPVAPDSGPLGPPEQAGHGIHVIGPEGVVASPDGGDSASTVRYYAKGRCPTCRIMFYRVRGNGDTSSHSHSEAQLQHVLDGSIKVGGFRVDAGMTFAVPADYRYGYRAADSWEVLVYRRDMSLMRRHPKDVPFLEA